MKHKSTFVLLFNLITLFALSMQQKLSNEEIIKNSLHLDYCKSWEGIKKDISHAINKGVNTVDVQQEDTWGLTPLCYAIEKNDLSFAEFLLKKGANPNFDIQGVHSSKPIFFARTLEMIQLLQSYGANLKEHNTGSGVRGGMNLLHSSINCNTEDDRIFDYLLEQGLDPKEPVNHGASLFHSLTGIGIPYCPEKRFMSRVQKLKKLGISPYQKGEKGTYFFASAIEHIQNIITQENTFLKNFDLGFGDQENRKHIVRKLEKFLHIMQEK